MRQWTSSPPAIVTMRTLDGGHGCTDGEDAPRAWRVAVGRRDIVCCLSVMPEK